MENINILHATVKIFYTRTKIHLKISLWRGLHFNLKLGYTFIQPYVSARLTASMKGDGLGKRSV